MLERLQTGGMGEVWLAAVRGPERFEKLVVVKRIAAHLESDPDFVEMFLSEARLAAQLSHSGLVQIFDLGDIEGRLGIVMEYVPGKSLRDLLTRTGGPLHPMHAAEIVSRVCAGLAYAHTARDMRGKPLELVHRDVNPNNVLCTWAGEVKLIDFGIAKSRLSRVRTAEGVIKGKFAYLSPEQGRGETLDHRSDLFAVGICLYQTLSGRNPFDGEDPGGVIDAIEHYHPPPLESFDLSLAPFDPLVRRALAKRPADRYQGADELRNDLELLMHSGVVPPPPQPLGEWVSTTFADDRAAEDARVARLARRDDSQPTRELVGEEASWPLAPGAHPRRRLLWLAAAGAVLAAVGALAVVFSGRHHATDEEPPALVEPPRMAAEVRRADLGHIRLALDPDLEVTVDGAAAEPTFELRRDRGTIVITGPKGGTPVKVLVAYRVGTPKGALWTIDTRPRLPLRIDGAPQARLPANTKGDVTLELTLPSRRHLKIGLRHQP